MSKVIVFATPVFLALIALEFFWSRRRAAASAAKGNPPAAYQLGDTINSISLGILSQVVGVVTPLLGIGIYTAVFSSITLFPEATFWTQWYGWVVALLFYDLCYYAQHRAGHRVAIFWAAHVVHHQSQHYNLSTALRQTSSGVLLSWIFYLPMALAGVPPLVFGIVALVDLLYQFWVHTEQVGKLGWFDRVFCSPSNHRVHHAVNDHYIDRNYGGLLVVWDRLFGTFQEEGEPCVYGTRTPLNSWNPLWANAEVYWALLQEAWHARRWRDKLLVWCMPPGWQSAAMAADRPKVAFAMDQVRRFNPPMRPAQQVFAALQFVLLLAGVSLFLGHAATLGPQQKVLWLVAIGLAVWAQGQFLQSRFTWVEVLLVEAAALATLASLPAMGLEAAYMALKPLPMQLALLAVMLRAQASGGLQRLDYCMLGALVMSLAGDVFLMLPGDYFLAGLGSFLVAHLFYLAALRLEQRWFPSKTALALVAAFGAGMYAVLWGSLGNAVLQMAVATYIGVISLMAAQAIGRAVVLKTAAARWVAMGAVVFMASDALIAINKFLTPIPDASLWVLATYFTAQVLIVRHLRARPATAPD